MNDKDICVTCAEVETCPCRKCWRGNGGIYHCTAYQEKKEPDNAGFRYIDEEKEHKKPDEWEACIKKEKLDEEYKFLTAAAYHRKAKINEKNLDCDNLTAIVAKDPEVQAVMAEVSDCIFKKAEEAFDLIFNKIAEITKGRATNESEK